MKICALQTLNEVRAFWSVSAEQGQVLEVPEAMAETLIAERRAIRVRPSEARVSVPSLSAERNSRCLS